MVVHNDMYTYEQFLKMTVGLGLALVFLHLFRFNIVFFWFSLDYFVLVLLTFVVLDFTTMPRDWLGRTSLKWRILCRVGRKTLTQSVIKVLTASEADHRAGWKYYGGHLHCVSAVFRTILPAIWTLLHVLLNENWSCSSSAAATHRQWRISCLRFVFCDWHGSLNAM